MFLPLKNKQVKLRGCGLELITMFVTIIKNAMRYFVADIHKLAVILRKSAKKKNIMAEPKAKTLQQKLGFFDEDLKSPVHDDILKWLDKNILTIIHHFYRVKDWNEDGIKQLENIANEAVKNTIEKDSVKIQNLENEIVYEKSKLEEINSNLKISEAKLKKGESLNYSETIEYIQSRLNSVNKNIDTKTEELNKLIRKLEKLHNWNGLGEPPTRNEVVIIDNKWEFPVTSRSSNSNSGYVSPKNIIGFIDLKVTFSYTKLSLTGINFFEKYVSENLKLIQTNEKIDFKNGYSDGKLTHSFYIEVKTKINSLGELFRQLNMYKEYVVGDYIVVCPDETEKEIIQNQGFKFYKYNNK